MSKSLDIQNCEIGTIQSRADHSCAFRVITPELRPSEAGELMGWHGRACRVAIFPHEGEAGEAIKIDTELDQKSQSQRIKSVLFILWKQEGEPNNFNEYYRNRTEKIIEHLKGQIRE
jgi:hypothetical protein